MQGKSFMLWLAVWKAKTMLKVMAIVIIIIIKKRMCILNTILLNRISLPMGWIIIENGRIMGKYKIKLSISLFLIELLN